MYPSADDPQFGAFVAKQAVALREIGVRVRLVVNTQAGMAGPRNLRKYVSLLARTAVAAGGSRFDAVVGHYLYPTAWFARVAAVLSRKPYVLVAHGSDVTSVQRSGFIARRCRSALPHAAAIVCVSGSLAERVRDELGLPAYVPVVVANMGVDRSVFRPVPHARDVLGLADDTRVVVFAGNLIALKNLETLIAAFASARAAGEADLLLIAGADREGRRAALEAQAREQDVGDAVRFLGALPADELAVVMTAADVFVLPSRNEALGVVLLEAMACGTPVVASRVGGIPEIVAPDCGVLVSSDDVGGFARAIGEVIAAGKERYRAACERVAEANDVRENARRLAEAIEHVVRREAL